MYEKVMFLRNGKKILQRTDTGAKKNTPGP